jgi:hypothetical protein
MGGSHLENEGFYGGIGRYFDGYGDCIGRRFTLYGIHNDAWGYDFLFYFYGKAEKKISRSERVLTFY